MTLTSIWRTGKQPGSALTRGALGGASTLPRVKVTDPHGRTWRVTRRWVPWRRRLRGDVGPGLDVLPSGLGDDPISMIILLVCLVVALPFLLLALLAGVELLLIVLLLPFAALGRVLLGRHWTVEAREGFTVRWEARSGDWQASGLVIHQVADAIRRGEQLPA